MRLKFVICKVLQKEAYLCAAKSSNVVDIVPMEQGLHNTPDVLRTEVQKELEKLADVAGNKYDAVLLGYVLCGNGITGLRCAIPLVVPRAHDCITLLLGSKERYREVFDQRPGTYYYSSGWLEYSERGGDRVEYPQKSGWVRQMTYEHLREQYGEDNARYLVEVMASWEASYSDGTLIAFPFDARLRLEEKVRKICDEKGWRFSTLPGDLALVRRLLDGEWDDGDFLVLQPREQIKATYDDNVIAAADGR